MGHFLKSICGVPMRPPNRGSRPACEAETERAVSALYDSGESANGIAGRLGLCHSHVVSILKRHGIYRRRRTRGPQLRLPDNEYQVGYIAGLLDGEGTIRQFSVRGREVVRVQIANTDRDLIAWLGSFGGAVNWDARDGRERANKPCAAWKVNRAIDCYRLLLLLEPHLIIKRTRAREAIRLLREKWGFG
jgi:hypothetical protein